MATRDDLDKCTEQCQDSFVSVIANLKSFGILNRGLENINRIQIDDCVFGAADGKKCDWLFEFLESGEEMAFYVELKGTNMNEAYKQLVETLKKLRVIHANSHRRCFIVCAETPRFNTVSQRLERKMPLDHKVLLKVARTPLRVTRSGETAP